MTHSYRYKDVPRSRIATFDTFSAGLKKHHIIALLEFDVTGSRKKLKEARKSGIKISFNGWLTKVISSVLNKHPEATAFRSGKKRLIIFDDINVSMIVEKRVGDNRVPIPVVLEKASEKSASEITCEIENARQSAISDGEIVLNRRSTFSERLYYFLPGFLRGSIWRIILKNPGFAYGKMGNAVITSVGMIGKINGWFIHRSVHPVSFGVGSILKKPVVIDNEIMVREILNMTILVDHDVIDGAPMVRFLNDLTEYIEKGEFIPDPST